MPSLSRPSKQPATTPKPVASAKAPLRSPFIALPPSVKSLIVQLVAWQDEAYHSRIARKEMPHVGEDAHSMESPAGGAGMAALALVNRELRALAAEHQFKVRSSLSYIMTH